MTVFDRYPAGGRKLLGRPASLTGSCRSGYGLSLQRLTGESACAYCGLSLTDDYTHWLLMSVDHVVPAGEARRLGIDQALYEDAINLVLCCAGCNGFGNRYRCPDKPQSRWTLEAFLALRERVFADRSDRIALRRASERDFFETCPWEVLSPN
jgi:hypothetical protein